MMTNEQKTAFGKLSVSIPAHYFHPTTWRLVAARSKDALGLLPQSPEGKAAAVKVKTFKGNRVAAEQALSEMLRLY